MKQNPFSLYDFLGYLIPGTLLIYSILVFSYYQKYPDSSFSNVLRVNSNNNFDEYFFFIILAYITGHILSFVSSLTIEKYGNWKFGFPSKFILGFKKNSYFIESLPENQDENKIYETTTDNRKKFINNFIRFILMLFLAPISFLDYFLGNIFYFRDFYQKKLDLFLIEAIKDKVIKLFKTLNIESTPKSGYYII